MWGHKDPGILGHTWTILNIPGHTWTYLEYLDIPGHTWTILEYHGISLNILDHPSISHHTPAHGDIWGSWGHEAFVG
jgi:hypothetical protein